MPTEFRLLGPLEVVEHDRPLVLGAGKPRALLALLLLNANEIVSTERLIEELWDGSPPATVAKSIHAYVSRLRKQLGSSRLLTRAPGYVLVVGPAELDVARFEQLVSEAAQLEPARAAGILREALALWRGPPLADLAYEPFVQPAVAWLEELRTRALERRIDAELACGRHRELIGELGTLIGERPLSEQLRGQLMLALYRCGRQAEALEAFRTARAVSVEELGIEPGRQLQELHAAILRQDPQLDLAEPHQAAGVFVGRTGELSELLAGLDDAFSRRGRLYLLDGEPGIGKSRLAEELAERARRRGGRVLFGRCWEGGGAPAYWPWTQALRAYVRTADEGTLRAALGSGGPELAQLIPELRVRFPELPQPSPLDPEGARFRLFDATAEFLRNAAEGRPLVLILDDLHVADAPSLLLLRFLARDLGSSRVLVLGAFRHVDPLPGERLTEMLAAVAREPVTRRLSLSGLSESEVAEYLRQTAASPQLAAALHERTEGNPLFVGEIVRLLSVERELSLPPSVRDVIARRIAHLSVETTRLLVLASVLGREFELELLARLAGVPEDALLEALDEAIAARVVADVPGAPGRMRFAHVLIRDTLYEGLSSARRLQLHRHVVAALDERRLPELAAHALAAGDSDKAVDYASRAAGRALDALAYDEAARLYRLALEALDDDAPERGELLLATGDALAKAGSTADAKATFLAAGALGDDFFARAALGYGGSVVWQRAGSDARLVPLLEEALAGLSEDDSPLRARLLGRLAGALRDEPSLERRSALSRAAVEMARRLGDDDTLATALTSQFMATWGPDVDELAAIAREVSRVARRSGSTSAITNALTLEGVVGWLTFADIELADQEYDTLAGQLGEAHLRWQGAMQNAHAALFRGDFDTAERLEEAARRMGGADADCSYRLAMFILRREQRRLAEVEDLLREAVSAYPGYRAFRCIVPVLECELGRERAARRAFDELAAEHFAALPRDSEWLFCLALLAEVAVRLDDRAQAEVLYTLLKPYARVNAMAAGEVALGPVARYLGILAGAIERWEEAAAHFEEALALNAKVGASPWVARTREDQARVRGQPPGTARP